MQPILLPLLLLSGGGRLVAAQVPSAVSSAVAGPISSITGSVTTQLAGSTQTGSSPAVASSSIDTQSGAVPTPTVEAESTASPTSTLTPDAIVGLEPIPAVQSWCLDPIYCSGQDILNTVELAKVFPDSKTFPDKPTRYGLNETVTAWRALRESNGNVTYSELETFLNDYFVAEGTELVPVQISANFSPSAAAFLPDVENELIRAWQTEVIGYWSSLIRETNQSALCTSPDVCDSTIIPLNNSVVVPGGRYREVYYWDSYWILQGLLHSGLSEYALDLLNNFMDQLDLYGFIPNGGRKYYLNRSQPPVFTQMVAEYVAFTNDTSILERALPLADIEFNFWTTNRTLSVTSPFTNTSYDVARYDVFLNTGPRPEGYVEDYETVNLAQPPLNETEAEDLYVQLASGAESGWDYTARWMKEPLKNVSDPLQGLRSLNIRSIIPVDLNALLTSNHYRLADLYDQFSLGGNSSTGGNSSSLSNATARADLHRMQGDKGKEAMLDLMWDAEKYSFYDFNMTSNARSDFWALSAFFPYWLDIFPPELQTDPAAAQKAYAGIDYVLAKYAGAVPASLTESTLNWDFPNAWPPLQYILAEGLDKLSANVTSQTYASLVNSTNGTLWDLIPAGQLGMNETDLPEQPGQAANATSAGIQAHDDYADESTTWRDAIQHAIVQRYTEAAFCSWYSTGGSLDGLLAQLPETELNLTNSNAQSTGKMFEKFNATDIDAAGGGGEYETPVGFGWTNGVVIFFGAKYGKTISEPRCPNINIQEQETVGGAGANTTATNVVGGEFAAVGAPKAKYAGSRIPYSS